MYLFIRPSVLFISKIDMLGHIMRAYGGKYGSPLRRHKILNQSKTGSTCKLGPDSATGVGDHIKKHRVPLRHFQPVLSFKGLKLDPQHTGILLFKCVHLFTALSCPQFYEWEP